ncbi:MAG: hypothetical protein HYS80_02290 [Candidatus Aenigmarchaeota archaeon]|nr:hypothetical protein [Candidatus Aenigmarchaeota archaeon]
MIGTNFSEFRLGGVGSRCNVVKLGVEIHPDFLENSIINFSLHIDITDNNPTGEAYPGPNATICDDESVDVEPLAIRAKFIWSRIQPGHIYRGLYNDTGTLGIYNVKYFANDTSNNINDLVSTSFEVLP